MITNREKKLHDIFLNAHQTGIFNGVVGAYQYGDPIYQAALGLSDIEKKQPLTLSSRFDLASITKQFTTSAVMLLKEKGKLNVDDNIEMYFPGIPYPGVSIKMLMNHTGGLPDEDWCVQYLEDTSKSINNDTLLNLVMTKPPQPLFAPGEGWTYCNLTYELLAMIIEQVSGMGFEEFLRDEIFIPADMRETSVYHRYSNLAPLENATNSYDWENDRWLLPEHSSVAAGTIPLEGVNGAGLVYSTIGDMCKWDKSLREGRVLSHSLQAEMRESVDCGDGRRYGYGWFVEREGRAVRHSGGWPGYINHYYRDLQSGAMLIMMTNMMRQDKTALLAMLDEAIAALTDGSD